MQQAPGWSAAIQAFKDNDEIMFGDVDMSQESSTHEAIAGTPNPLNIPPWAESQVGHDGWPTIRFYNEQTGSSGASYEQVTEKELSAELADLDTLLTWIEAKAGTRACDVKTGKGCNAKDLKYVRKWQSDKSLADYKKQAKLLTNQLKSRLTKEASASIMIRKKLLAQMVANAFPDAEL